MRLKPAQGLLLVDNANSNNYHIGDIYNDKLSTSDITSSDTNSNSNFNQNTTNFSHNRSEEWKCWEDNRQDNLSNQRQPNLNSPDYAEVSSSSSGSSEEESSSDWEVEEIPKTGFVNPNYPGFQHLANSEQTGFPRDISIDSLDEGSNPLTSVSELTSTPGDSDNAIQRISDDSCEHEIDEKAKEIWNEVKELSSKIPCSLEQSIIDKSEDSWKNYEEEESAYRGEDWKAIENDKGIEELSNFENTDTSDKEDSDSESDLDRSEKKDPEKDVNLEENSEDNNNNEERKIIDEVNKLDETDVKEIYSKDKLNNLVQQEIKQNNMEVEECSASCYLRPIKETENKVTEVQRPNSLKPLDCARPAGPECLKPIPMYPASRNEFTNDRLDIKPIELDDRLPEKSNELSNERLAGKSSDSEVNNDTNRSEKGEREAAPRKKEKTEINMNVKKMSTQRSSTSPRSSKGSLDYQIETVMPQIDLEAIETHLRAAREEERRRRNEREEIRRRLATGDLEDLPPTDRPGKKPSLQSRLQSGMNLQICFMNDAMSDSESPSSDSSPHSLPPTPKAKSSSSLRSLPPYTQMGGERGRSEMSEASRLQAEARAALSQAQGLARMQMHQERRKLATSPITEMLRNSLKKVGVELAEGRRRLSRQLLTDMNVAQLQVIVNDLHTQIEKLNEGLVKYLMERDELHMGQDSMLVDIEDLTRYLGAKESLVKEELAQNNINQNNNIVSIGPSKPTITRIVSHGKK